MAKYLRKPEYIDAIIFEYSDNGIVKLKEFLGASLLNTKKQRHLGSIGEATIRTNSVGYIASLECVAYEGDYIVKDEFGFYIISKPEVFNKTYELVK